MSRIARGSSPSVAASSASTCSIVIAFGKRIDSFGGDTSTAGSDSAYPSSTRKRWKPRTDDSTRASDDAVSGRSGRVRNAVTNALTSAVATDSGRSMPCDASEARYASRSRR